MKQNNKHPSQRPSSSISSISASPKKRPSVSALGEYATPTKARSNQQIFQIPEPEITPQKPLNSIVEIGPTPQVHGKVMGLFDIQPFTLFNSPSNRLKNPFPTPESKKSESDNSTDENEDSKNLRKRGLGDENCPPISENESFTTPKKQKTGLSNSPLSNSPMGFSLDDENSLLVTPKYIHQASVSLRFNNSTSSINTIGSNTFGSGSRRTSSKFFDDSLDDNSSFTFSPGGPRKIKRGLSSMIAEYKHLKEVEESKNTPENENKTKDSEPADSKSSDDQAEQEINDNESNCDDFDHLGEVQENEDEIDTSNGTRRTYKKKGQKRTTRRHVFRPDIPSDEKDTMATAKDISKNSNESEKPVKNIQNFKRLKLHNSGFKGRPIFFKKR